MDENEIRKRLAGCDAEYMMFKNNKGKKDTATLDM